MRQLRDSLIVGKVAFALRANKLEAAPFFGAAPYHALLSVFLVVIARMVMVVAVVMIIIGGTRSNLISVRHMRGCGMLRD